MKKMILALATLGLMLGGCASSNDSVFTGTPPPSASPGAQAAFGRIQVSHPLAVEGNVSSRVDAAAGTFRFTAKDAQGQVLFGPVTFARARTTLLDRVPVAIKALRVEYLSADGRLLHFAELAVNVIPDETVQLSIQSAQVSSRFYIELVNQSGVSDDQVFILVSSNNARAPEGVKGIEVLDIPRRPGAEGETFPPNASAATSFSKLTQTGTLKTPSGELPIRRIEADFLQSTVFFVSYGQPVFYTRKSGAWGAPTEDTPVRFEKFEASCDSGQNTYFTNLSTIDLYGIPLKAERIEAGTGRTTDQRTFYTSTKSFMQKALELSAGNESIFVRTPAASGSPMPYKFNPQGKEPQPEFVRVVSPKTLAQLPVRATASEVGTPAPYASLESYVRKLAENGTEVRVEGQEHGVKYDYKGKFALNTATNEVDVRMTGRMEIVPAQQKVYDDDVFVPLNRPFTLHLPLGSLGHARVTNGEITTADNYILGVPLGHYVFDMDLAGVSGPDADRLALGIFTKTSEPGPPVNITGSVASLTTRDREAGPRPSPAATPVPTPGLTIVPGPRILVTPGSTLQLQALDNVTRAPASATWTSVNGEATGVTVNGQGLVSIPASASGVAPIRATAQSFSATSDLIVTPGVTAITVNQVVNNQITTNTGGNLSFDRAPTINLRATIAGKDETVGVVWASSNTSVAKVDFTGTVTAVDPGEADITASVGAVVTRFPVKVQDTERFSRASDAFLALINTSPYINVYGDVMVGLMRGYPGGVNGPTVSSADWFQKLGRFKSYPPFAAARPDPDDGFYYGWCGLVYNTSDSYGHPYDDRSGRPEVPLNFPPPDILRITILPDDRLDAPITTVEPTGGGLNVRWGSVEGATNYTVTVEPQDQPWTQTLGAQATSLSLTGESRSDEGALLRLQPGTPYTVQVRASAAGSSSEALIATATTTGEAPLLPETGPAQWLQKLKLSNNPNVTVSVNGRLPETLNAEEGQLTLHGQVGSNTFPIQVTQNGEVVLRTLGHVVLQAASPPEGITLSPQPTSPLTWFGLVRGLLGGTDMQVQLPGLPAPSPVPGTTGSPAPTPPPAPPPPPPFSAPPAQVTVTVPVSNGAQSSISGSLNTGLILFGELKPSAPRVIRPIILPK